MDLRPYLPSTDRVERAAGVLNYQPFMLSDDVQTGVAYSFVNGGDPRVSPPLLFRRRDFEDRWDAITDANARLRAMPAAAADIERKAFGEVRIVRQKIQPFALHGAAIATRDAPHFEFQNNPKSCARQVANLPHPPVVPAVADPPAPAANRFFERRLSRKIRTSGSPNTPRRGSFARKPANE